MNRVQPSCTREDLDEQWSHMEAMTPTEGTAQSDEQWGHMEAMTPTEGTAQSDEQWGHMEAMSPTGATVQTDDTAQLLQFEESHFEGHCQPGADENCMNKKIGVVV